MTIWPASLLIHVAVLGYFFRSMVASNMPPLIKPAPSLTISTTYINAILKRVTPWQTRIFSASMQLVWRDSSTWKIHYFSCRVGVHFSLPWSNGVYLDNYNAITATRCHKILKIFGIYTIKVSNNNFWLSTTRATGCSSPDSVFKCGVYMGAFSTNPPYC